MSFNRVLIWLLIGGVSGYLIWFLINYQYVFVNHEMVYSAAAQQNRFLAAQRFLQQSQRNSRSKRFYRQVVPNLAPDDSLFLVQYEQTLDEEQSKAVLDWVARGGHLLFISEMLDYTIGRAQVDSDVETETETQADDTEAAKQEVVVDASDSDADDDSRVLDYIHQQLQVSQYENKTLWPPEYHRPFDIEHYGATWRVQFLPYFYLKAMTGLPPIWQFDSQYGNHVLHFAWGNGYITMLSDSELFENYNIEKYDHAAFLWALLHVERTPATVWFLDNEREVIPSLLDLLWQYAWSIVIVALIILVFWLWCISQRFGSVLPSPPQARRRLLEHIEASGHFLWRHEQAGLLLDSVRQALHDRIAQVHPDWAHLPQHELVAHLAHVSHFDRADIERALQQSVVNRPTQFTQAIQILTQIRKQL